ncbi:ECF RNA polymerase sigma factor SigW [Methylacidimicrobium cyclopophantes]|uniref:ECF RNA polymerase sigma factor SigW n=1 Tax=Methylacidimicrobium cyclopophantes TaxID=1041766 RepID=A0A5E6MQC6_9BACT|nr:sigma-70 family RNA polymerase sigma factor [Methylacidimicrobium cyclopophantes]VVM08320.1 ECF RNA polymerase sigma factor SigW [Methylacidimicrobium cyclopophantes]
MNSEAGQDSLFHALLSAWEGKLLLYADSIIGDSESARDIVQQSFLKLAKALRGERRDSAGGGLPMEKDPQRRWRAWLFTVTRNGALDHLRKRKALVPEEVLRNVPSNEPTPRSSLERRDLVNQVFERLESLNRLQREAIRLRFQDDLSYKEIAQVMDVSISNVGFLLHVGLKKLRELLKEELQAMPSECDGGSL